MSQKSHDPSFIPHEGEMQPNLRWEFRLPIVIILIAIGIPMYMAGSVWNLILIFYVFVLAGIGMSLWMKENKL